MVEQNANMALSIATRGYVVQTGRIVLTDRPPTCSTTSSCAKRTSDGKMKD